MRLLDDVDFLDVVATSFGFLILGALLASHFLGYPENPITKSLQEWFFAILGFIIGKKGFLPKGVTGCVGCVNYRITGKEIETPSAEKEVLSEKEEAPDWEAETASQGVETASQGVETASQGVETADQGAETPSQGEKRP